MEINSSKSDLYACESPSSITDQFMSISSVHSKKIGLIRNLYPRGKPLRFRIDLPNLKSFRLSAAEPFLSSADRYGTSKVLLLDTGFLLNLFFRV